MGKTTMSKLELASSTLGIQTYDINSLVSLLAQIISRSHCNGIVINAMSNKLIKDLLQKLTEIHITPSNLCYYKNKYKNGRIVHTLANDLSICVCDWVSCDISKQNNFLLFEPSAKSAVSALHNLLDKSIGPEALESTYNIWSNNGWNVGDKRNWIDKNLLQWLIQHELRPTIPISHSRPTELRIVYKQLTKLSKIAHSNCPINSTINQWIDESILDFCNKDIKKKQIMSISKWLRNYSYLPEIKYVRLMDAKHRLVPYLYCYSISELQTKFGKANNSIRFKGLDRGIVISMKREGGDEALTKCESIILRELCERGINPIDGKKESFQASCRDLCNVILDICSSKYELRSRIISISATHEYCS